METISFIDQDVEKQAKDQVESYVKFVEYRNKRAMKIHVQSDDVHNFAQIKKSLGIGQETTLILSVAGPSNNFPISIRLKNAFKNGLIDIIDSIEGTLIITG
jgi:hypothetical protein